jgi:23S rRNA (adenine2503-C2)-methyltransferase
MTRDMKPLLRDQPVDTLSTVVEATGEPGYRTDQLARWLYRDAVLDWENMSNLPQTFREGLAESYDVRGLTMTERQISRDGTRKFLFELRDGHRVESVAIPMEKHVTFCISSQVGCAMACSFCATARGGLVRNLSAGEIVEQVLSLAEDMESEPVGESRGRGYNIVFMGMGEPLDNMDAVETAIANMTAEAGLAMSSRRITISTSGHAEGLERLISSGLSVGLTVSVNTCRPDLRRRLMPRPGRTPLPDILDLAERYARDRRQRATIAYVLIGGVNDDDAEATALGRMVKGRPFKVNLIPLNRIDERQGPPDTERILSFQSRLKAEGVEAYLRVSGGDDIAAACGQLREERGRQGKR